MATNRRPRSLVPSRVKLLLVRLRSSQLPQSPRGRGQPRASHTADDAQKIHSGQNPTFAVSHMGQDNLSHGRAPMDGWQCHCGRRRGTAVSRGAAVYSTFHAKHETDPREAADFRNSPAQHGTDECLMNRPAVSNPVFAVRWAVISCGPPMSAGVSLAVVLGETNSSIERESTTCQLCNAFW